MHQCHLLEVAASHQRKREVCHLRGFGSSQNTFSPKSSFLEAMLIPSVNLSGAVKNEQTASPRVNLERVYKKAVTEMQTALNRLNTQTTKF